MGSPIDLLLYCLLLPSGLLLPGWLLGRILRSPVPALSAFLGSAVLLFDLVLGFDALQIRLGPVTLAGGLAVLNVALLVMAWRLRPSPATAPTPPAPEPVSLTRWFWLVPPALALVAIAARAIGEPLSGFDNIFRWDFLARQMLSQGNLNFYPPVTAGDFTRYGWGDGIPPLVSVLNLWSYISGGHTDAFFTAPRVLAEATLLGWAVFLLSRRLWGEAAGGPAVAALATSSLLIWGVAMGQETGLTALTLVGMFLFLEEHALSGARSALFWAGLAAGMGGLCREYGLAWPMIGLVVLAWHGRLKSSGWKFLLTAVAVAAPWYLRNWMRTGNPLFGHSLGLFPTNPVQAELLQIYWGLFSIKNNLEMLPFALKFLAVTLGGLVFLGGWQAVRQWRRAGHVIFGAGAISLLWLWTVCQAAGGWVYASRVLTPALALGAVLAGGALAGLSAARRPLIAGLLALVAVDAACRSLYLPNEPLVSPAQFGSSHWRDFGLLLDQRYHHPVWRVLIAEAGGRGMIVDDPAFHAVFAEQGARPVPLMSPEISFLFDESLSLDEISARLQRTRIRFLILTRTGPLTAPLIERHRFFQELIRRRKPVFTFGGQEVYDWDIPAP